MPKTGKRQEAQLIKLVEPKFLSVVGLPANRTGFKVLRSAKSETDIVPTRKRRKKRGDNSLLSMDFPVGLTETEASDLMVFFGMQDDYDLRVDDEGQYFLKRKESNISEDDTTPIDLGGGYVANVEATAFTSQETTAITGVTLVGLEMDGYETIEEVQGWLDGRGINYKADGIELFDGGAAVTRHDIPEETEVRKVRIAEGVTGLVSRTENTDIPAKVYRSVIEQAYGNWGWGHLNFATALADPEFTDSSWNAIYVLQDILENIILYSGLPLDERKTLVQNAMSEFYSYIAGLMDSLPRAVIEQARADRNAKQETITMSKESEDSNVKRVDSASAEETKEKKDNGTSKDEKISREEEAKAKDSKAAAESDDKTDDTSEYVTRGELKEVVSEVIREALGSKKEEKATRDDEEHKDPVIQAIDAMRKDFDEKFDLLKSEVDELGGSTVARSDADDASEDEHTIKRDEDKSPFSGMFAGRLV